MCIYDNSYEVTYMHESNAQSHFFNIVLVPNYAWYETVYFIYFFIIQWWNYLSWMHSDLFTWFKTLSSRRKIEEALVSMQEKNMNVSSPISDLFWGILASKSWKAKFIRRFTFLPACFFMCWCEASKNKSIIQKNRKYFKTMKIMFSQ